MKTKKTKTEIKDLAKFELSSAMQVAFNSITERRSGSYIEDDNERAAVFAEMDKQFVRVENLLGYKPGSWQRGC